MASRALTAGEVAMASALFGAAIDYAKVRIHDRRYLPFQPKNCAMTPNGRMYFHRSCFLDDYSAAGVHAQRWFMHEITHVCWFTQLFAVGGVGADRLWLSLGRIDLQWTLEK